MLLLGETSAWDTASVSTAAETIVSLDPELTSHIFV